jgi:hypothetical protein
MGPAQERLKVHRRSVRLDGRAYTVLSPRPSVSSRFATSRDGATCQILTDPVGAQLLARLCWAMAYQRHQRTVTVIDPPFLVPDPFGAEPSSPIVIANSDLGSLNGPTLADLHSQLPLATPSDGTVVLQTRGLDQALDDPTAFGQRADQVARRSERHQERWIDGDSGLWVLTAPPPVLRAWAVELAGPDGEGAGAGEVRVLASMDDQAARSVAPPNHPLSRRSPTAG